MDHLAGYHNLDKEFICGCGNYGIPELNRITEYKADNWISFNYAKTCEEPEKHAVHFFVDDYQFERCWNRPATYTKMLKKFQCVTTPDYSTYIDYPKAAQIYNHYKKHWLGAYWQKRGLTVIPTIEFGDETSLEWCFEGEPTHSVIAIGDAGHNTTENFNRLYKICYEEMIRVLKPEQIILYGKKKEFMHNDNVIEISTFIIGLRERGKNAKK